MKGNRRLWLLFAGVPWTLALLCIMVVGCGETTQASARDVIATANALLITAQAQYKTSCIANPAQTVCIAINKAGAAQNVALDALSVYCGFTSSTPAGTVCTPVASGLAALQGALANLGAVTADLKSLLGVTKLEKQSLPKLKNVTLETIADYRYPSGPVFVFLPGRSAARIHIEVPKPCMTVGNTSSGITLSNCGGGQ